MQDSICITVRLLRIKWKSIKICTTPEESRRSSSIQAYLQVDSVANYSCDGRVTSFDDFVLYVFET